MRSKLIPTLLGSSFLTSIPTMKSTIPQIKIDKIGYKGGELSAGSRALIVPPRVVIDPVNRSLSFRPDATNYIRAGLLMWDAFDFPVHSAVGFDFPIADQLTALGVARRTLFSAHGDFSEALVEGYASIFRAYEEIHPNSWSLLEGPDGLHVLGAGKHHAAALNFTSCIPVPSSEVPFEEILYFKERRRDEMLELRYHIEKLIDRFKQAGDGERLLDAEVDKFKQAIEDHLKVAKESGLRFKLGDLSATFNILSPIAGGAAAFMQNLPISSGLIAGAIAGLGFSPSFSVSYNRIGPTPLRYISRAHRELSWS